MKRFLKFLTALVIGLLMFLGLSVIVHFFIGFITVLHLREVFRIAYYLLLFLMVVGLYVDLGYKILNRKKDKEL